MKYIPYIFENQNLLQTVVNNEALVGLAANAVINHNLVLESYIHDNLPSFVDNDNISSIYENIRNFVIGENTALYSQFSEILADNQLTNEEKAYCFEASSNLNGSTQSSSGAAEINDPTPTWSKDALPRADDVNNPTIASNGTPNVLSGIGNFKAEAGQMADRAAAKAANLQKDAIQHWHNAKDAARQAGHHAQAGLDNAWNSAKSAGGAAVDHVAANPHAYAGGAAALAAGAGAYGIYHKMKKHKR